MTQQHVMPRWFRGAGVAAFVLIVIALVAVPSGGRLYAEPAAAVTMKVQNVDVQVGTERTTQIMVDIGTAMDPNGLGAWEGDLVYDSTFFEVSNVSSTSGLGSTGRSQTLLGPIIDTAGGRTAVGEYSWHETNPSLAGPTGDNIPVANVTVKGKKAGTQTLGLENVLLTDTQANPWSGGNVQVVPGQVRVYTFSDVPPDHGFWSFVESFSTAGITSGCGNGNYCAEDPVTRAQMAVFLLRALHGSNFTPPAATGTVFGDVSQSSFAAAFIEAFLAEGITSGCGGGNYCPNDPVTRAQMAVFLMRALHGSDFTPPAATGTVFGDVSQNSFAAAFIEAFLAEGITSGCGGGNYCPNDPVTRGQMAVFMVRGFNLQ